jgi:hypothetical protein
MILGVGEHYPEGRGHIGDEYVTYPREDRRERKQRRQREDYNPFHIDSETKAEEEICISSETEAEEEEEMGDRHEHLEDRGKGQAPPLDNTLRILNDLSRGQDVMMQAIAQMAASTQEIQSSMGNIGASGAGGVSGSSGNATGASDSQSPTRTYTTSTRKIPRPLFPHFQGGQQIGNQGQGQPTKNFTEYKREYMALGLSFMQI